MSCPNSNAPIDISQINVQGLCDLKCSYNFKYPNSSCVVTNRGEYLSLSYDNFSSSPVQYNAVDYNVKEIRIYNPSIHTFDGKKAVGEIIIIHISNKGTNPLLVCIPLTSSSSNSVGSTLLTTIIDNTSLHAPSNGESTTITMNDFSLDAFVPKKQFYSYTAIQPYQPCVGNVDIIVFSAKLAQCYITSDSLTKLESINTPNTYTTKTGPLLFLNTKGPGKSGLGDEIYIDCQPVDKSQQQTTITTSSTSSSSNTFTIDWDTIKSNPAFQIIVGSLLFVFILIIFSMLLTLMSGGTIELPDFNKSKSNIKVNTR